MNTTPFPGHGMRAMPASDAAEAAERGGPVPDSRLMTATEAAALEEAADAVSEALSEPIPHAASGDRAIFERSIAARRAEKAKQQAIAAAAMAKVRSLTASIRSMDALDGLLVSEVA